MKNLKRWEHGMEHNLAFQFLATLGALSPLAALWFIGCAAGCAR